MSFILRRNNKKTVRRYAKACESAEVSVETEKTVAGQLKVRWVADSRAPSLPLQQSCARGEPAVLAQRTKHNATANTMWGPEAKNELSHL